MAGNRQLLKRRRNISTLLSTLYFAKQPHSERRFPLFKAIIVPRPRFAKFWLLSKKQRVILINSFRLSA